MTAQQTTATRKIISAHQAARSFSSAGQEALDAVVEGIKENLATFLDVSLQDVAPQKETETWDDVKAFIADFTAHFHTPPTDGDAASGPETLVSVDTRMINTVATRLISGDCAPSDEPAGAVETQLATALATTITDTIKAATQNIKAGSAHKNIGGASSNTGNAPAVAGAPVSELDQFEFVSEDKQFIRLVFDVQTLTDEMLGRFCMTFPTSLLPTAENTNRSDSSSQRYTVDYLSSLLCVNVHALIAKQTMPFDEVLSLTPGAILSLPGAAIDGLCLSPASNADIDLGFGALGVRDGVRAMSISSV